jgi:5-methylcytosine-specific restriction endonuclease McrA
MTIKQIRLCVPSNWQGCVLHFWNESDWEHGVSGPKDTVRSWRKRKLRRARLHALGLQMDQYEKYLETAHWQGFRKLVLTEQLKRIGRNECERCPPQPNSEGEGDVELHVHHLTYERLGRELIEDVQIICRECHDREHGRDARNRVRHYAPGYRD